MTSHVSFCRPREVKIHSETEKGQVWKQRRWVSWLEPAWTIQSLHPKEQCTPTDQTTAQVDLFFPRYVFKRPCLFATKSLIMKDGDMINYNKVLKVRILPKPDKTLLRNYLELSVRWQRIHLFLQQTVRTPHNYFDFTSLLHHWKECQFISYLKHSDITASLSSSTDVIKGKIRILQNIESGQKVGRPI